MNLKELTSPALISTGQSFQSQEEVIRYLIRQLAGAGKLHSEEASYRAVMDREGQGVTGFEGGLAIPHGKSQAVKEAAFAVVTLAKPLTTWESIDPDNRVELVILLAIPDDLGGSLHISLLAELATRLGDPAYKERLLRSATSQELYDNLEGARAEEWPSARTGAPSGKTILAITACPAGIAHTYMAAEALRQAGEELGVAVFVEKQGANGIEDRHTSELLRKADAVISAFAVTGATLLGSRYFTDAEQEVGKQTWLLGLEAEVVQAGG
jgi:2-O-A-mannosyl-D-glycerate PTS system EIIABC component